MHLHVSESMSTLFAAHILNFKLEFFFFLNSKVTQTDRSISWSHTWHNIVFCPEMNKNKC